MGVSAKYCVTKALTLIGSLSAEASEPVRAEVLAAIAVASVKPAGVAVVEAATTIGAVVF